MNIFSVFLIAILSLVAGRPMGHRMQQWEAANRPKNLPPGTKWVGVGGTGNGLGTIYEQLGLQNPTQMENQRRLQEAQQRLQLPQIPMGASIVAVPSQQQNGWNIQPTGTERPHHPPTWSYTIRRAN